MRKKKVSILVVGLCVVVVATAFAARAAEFKWPKQIVVGVAAAKGSNYIVSSAIGEVVKKHTPIEYWLGLPLGGPAGYAPKIRSGEVDLGVHSSAALYDMLFGLRESKGDAAPIRTVMGLFSRSFGFVTTTKAGIKSMADLRGKVVYTKMTGNRLMQELSRLYLESAGLTEKDLKASLAASGRSAIPDLLEGKVDAWSYPLIPGVVKQINAGARGDFTMVPLTKQQAEYVCERRPGFTVAVIKKGEMGIRHEVRYAVRNQVAWIGRANLDPELVYRLLKAIFDHRDEWVNAHPYCKEITPEAAATCRGPVYHEGAIRYFKEKGLWTDEMQKYNDSELKKLKKQQG